MIFVLIYAYLEVRPKFTFVDYAKNFLLEGGSHLVGWIIGILVAQLFRQIIEGGIAPHDNLSYYKVGLLLLIAYDSAVIFSLFAAKVRIERKPAETGTCIVGLGTAYVLFLLCKDSLLQGVTVSQPYIITLSILSGAFALLYKIAMRAGS